jgi:ESCRT-II complex subunit VPS22
MSKLFDKSINDFYYELAIQITNICIALRPKNGGFLEEQECLRLLNKLRGERAQRVELEDVSKALESLE